MKKYFDGKKLSKKQKIATFGFVMAMLSVFLFTVFVLTTTI